MGSLSAVGMLQLPVRLQGIELGRPVDLLIETDSWRALGFVVRCRDESHRFLPYMASQPLDHEIAVGSALMLLEDVAFYRKRGASFRSLLDGQVGGGVFRDAILSLTGEVTEIEIVRGEAIERIPAASARVLPTRASAA